MALFLVTDDVSISAMVCKYSLRQKKVTCASRLFWLLLDLTMMAVEYILNIFCSYELIAYYDLINLNGAIWRKSAKSWAVIPTNGLNEGKVICFNMILDLYYIFFFLSLITRWRRRVNRLHAARTCVSTPDLVYAPVLC